MHIGSSSSMPTTSPDAPLAVSMSLNAQNAQGSVCDWVFSRTLERFPRIKIAYAESQVGWMPFQYERMDAVWHEDVGGVDLAEPPSTYIRGRVYGCIFDDLHGLQSRDVIGMEHIMFETDYPHGDGTWPDSQAVFEKYYGGLPPDEVAMISHETAAKLFRHPLPPADNPHAAGLRR
jgi:predicted TIM-barrel fold metal-dependent hydrolase